MSCLLLVDVYFTFEFLDAKLNVIKLIVIEYGYHLFETIILYLLQVKILQIYLIIVDGY